MKKELTNGRVSVSLNQVEERQPTFDKTLNVKINNKTIPVIIISEMEVKDSNISQAIGLVKTKH